MDKRPFKLENNSLDLHQRTVTANWSTHRIGGRIRLLPIERRTLEIEHLNVL